MEKVKSFLVKAVVFIINVALVAGGVFFIKNQQRQKQAEADLVAANEAEKAAQSIGEQASQLQQIVEQNRNQKTDSVASNPSQVTVQKPTVITETIPAQTKAVNVSTSTSAPAPKATTKKS